MSSRKGASSPVEESIDAIIGEVALRHHVLLDRDDPLLVAVTIFAGMRKELLAEIGDLIRESTDRIAAAGGEHAAACKGVAESLVTGSGSYAADQVRRAMDEARVKLLEDVQAQAEGARAAARGAWRAAVAGGGAALVTAGAVAGYFLALVL